MGDTYRELYGNLDRALEAFEEALEFARRREDHHRETIMLSLIGIVRFEQKAKDADRYLEKAYKLSKAHNDDFGLNSVLQNMSYVAGSRKDYTKARELSLESIEVSRRLASLSLAEKSEVDYILFFSMLNLLVAEHRLERLEEALVACENALNLAKERNNELWIGYVLQEMGEVYHKMKNHTLAQENFNGALNLYRRNSAKSDEENLAAFITSQGYSLPEEVMVT
jgi:tetratricopeptide (TPR) repeat protein